MRSFRLIVCYTARALRKLRSTYLSLVATTFLAMACGGGGGSSTPTTPQPPPPPPPPPSNNWSIAGTVVDTVGHQPIGGAGIAPSWNLASVSADGAGAYSLGSTISPPQNPAKVTVSANGFLSREQW